MLSAPLSAQTSVVARPTARAFGPLKAPLRARKVAAHALSDTSVIISGATAASLALGRFVFLPFQRDNVSRQGVGTHPLLLGADICPMRASGASYELLASKGVSSVAVWTGEAPECVEPVFAIQHGKQEFARKGRSFFTGVVGVKYAYFKASSVWLRAAWLLQASRTTRPTPTLETGSPR